MRFAEVFLRLGTAFVAWMMLFTHFVWLAVLYVTGCGPDGDEMHRLLLGLVPFTCAFAFLTGVTDKFAEIHRMMRWLGVPLLLLTPFCLRTVWSVFDSVNLQGLSFCGTGELPSWQQFWAPLQMLTVIVVLVLLARAWRRAPAAGDGDAAVGN